MDDLMPLKLALHQIHQNCSTIISDANLAAFVDHHVILIRNIAKTYFKEIEPILQESITTYFKKIRQLINGKYFQEFYIIISNILTSQGNLDKNNTFLFKNQRVNYSKRLFAFIDKFYKFVNNNEEYADLTIQ